LYRRLLINDHDRMSYVVGKNFSHRNMDYKIPFSVVVTLIM